MPVPSIHAIFLAMMYTVEIEAKQNEQNSSVLRRFTQRVRNAGVLKQARSLRYRERPQSDYVKKKEALKRLDRIREIERLKKLGKLN